MHGRPAEAEPDTAIHTHRPNTRQAKPNWQGPKLYSKVLAIEPNRGGQKSSIYASIK